MAIVEKHAPGSFCWIELGTTDQAAAKNFYGKLFGWEPQDMPMGPGDLYTIFHLRGQSVAAGYTLRPGQKSAGVPPHWMLYVAVASADDAAARVKSLGGTVMMDPFDVFDVGRMGVMQDPTGAVFCVWQPKRNAGVGIIHEKGSFTWADLMTPDPEAAKRFYSQLFGWKIEVGDKDSSGYLHIRNGEHFIGGIPPAQHRNPNAPPHWLAYFEVDDCDATTTSAKQLGARAYVEPMSMEGVGRWSVLADPQGAVFAAFQPFPRKL
jgi:uncharacterized protein